MSETCSDFIVKRDDFSQSKFVDAKPVAEIELKPGELTLEVEKFAFTANNITYAVAGDMLSYWDFFPAEDGWGRVPVWGIAKVTASAHDEVSVGERYYGYFPMSDYLVVQAQRVNKTGFIDGSEHRSHLAPTYNQYQLMTEDNGFVPEQDDHQIVLRPLFMTGFVIADFLFDNDFYGAQTVVLSSASSKTSYGLAYLLKQNYNCKVVGLTSTSNLEFVDQLGCYDEIKSYQQIAELDAQQAAVFVDMAGSAEVRGQIHNHYQDQLKYSCSVGITHWQAANPGAELPGPTPEMFFAPTQIQKRSKDWGAQGLQQRMAEAWTSLLPHMEGRLAIKTSAGQAAVEDVYQQTLAGTADPAVGYVLKL